MERKLFCEFSPMTYRISVEKNRWQRRGKDFLSQKSFAKEKAAALPCGVVYRVGEVYRSKVDKKTGQLLEKELLRQNHARVMYDTTGLEIEED